MPHKLSNTSQFFVNLYNFSIIHVCVIIINHNLFVSFILRLWAGIAKSVYWPCSRLDEWNWLDSWQGLPDRCWGSLSLLFYGYWKALSLVVQPLGHKADHSCPSSAKVKNACSNIPFHLYFFMAWCLVKHMDSFTFIWYYVWMLFWFIYTVTYMQCLKDKWMWYWTM